MWAKVFEIPAADAPDQTTGTRFYGSRVLRTEREGDMLVMYELVVA